VKVRDVEERVAKIAAAAKEEGSCTPHVLEDSLYLDVLKAIAEGAADVRKLAAAAIKASELNFERWYE